MPWIDSGGIPRYPTRAQIRHDEAELAEAILQGAGRRPDQAFGDYFVGFHASCALGAAYEGMYRLPQEAEGLRPRDLWRLFDCLEYSLRPCPEGCRKRLSLATMILHLNDDHRWSRERIAAWVAPEPEAATPSAAPGP